MYRIFESTIDSDIPLAGLPHAPGEGAGFTVRRGDRAPSPANATCQYTWHEPGGDAVLHYSVVESSVVQGSIEDNPAASHSSDNTAEGDVQHILRFPDLAQFCVQGSSVTCFPDAECDDDTLSHLLVDQVLPRMWAHLGNCVLHGSAVVYPDGGVGLFLGESGLGKSTLATALAEQGCILLSDDCVSVVPEKSAIRVVPSYRSLRLYQDVISKMAKSGKVVGPIGGHSQKMRLEIDQPGLPSDLCLRRIYILDGSQGEDRISATSLAGAELLAELIKASFMLDVRNADMGSSQLQVLGVVANTVPSASRLFYPRELELLPSVAEFLLA
jgi:hypothetical protein